MYRFKEEFACAHIGSFPDMGSNLEQIFTQTFTDVVVVEEEHWQFEEYCNLIDWLMDKLVAFLDNDYYKLLIQTIAKY